MNKNVRPTIYNVCNYLRMLVLHLSRPQFVKPTMPLFFFHAAIPKQPVKMYWKTNKEILSIHLGLNKMAAIFTENQWTPCHIVATSHYSDVIMSTITSQITGLSIVYSTICSGPDQRKHQSSASLAFVGGFHRWPVNSPHKGPVTRTMFPFDDVIM